MIFIPYSATELIQRNSFNIVVQVLFRGGPLSSEIADEIFIGHLNDKPSKEDLSVGKRVDLLGDNADEVNPGLSQLNPNLHPGPVTT